MELYVDKGSGYEATGISDVYDSSGATEEEEWGSSLQYDFPRDTGYSKLPGRVVVTYTLKDGTTGTVNSNNIVLYAGDYVTGTSVSYVKNLVIIDLEIDSSLVSAADVDVQYLYFDCDDVTVYEPTDVNKNGNHIYLTLDIGTGHENKQYWSFVELVYSEGDSNWPSNISLEGTLEE